MAGVCPHSTPAKKKCTGTDNQHCMLCRIAYCLRQGCSQGDFWLCDSDHLRLNASDGGLGTKASLTLSVFWRDLVRSSSAVYETETAAICGYFLAGQLLLTVMLSMFLSTVSPTGNQLLAGNTGLGGIASII